MLLLLNQQRNKPPLGATPSCPQAKAKPKCKALLATELATNSPCHLERPGRTASTRGGSSRHSGEAEPAGAGAVPTPVALWVRSGAHWKRKKARKEEGAGIS